MKTGYLEELESALRLKFGDDVRFVLEESLPSTMDSARLILSSPASGISTGGKLCGIVVAAEQTLGRGRQGRSWSSVAGGGIFCSLAYSFPGEIRSLLPLAAGLGIVTALSSYSPRIALKWPNDIVVRDAGDGRVKIGGVLVESSSSGGLFSAVVGFGINLTGAVPDGGAALEDLTLLPLDRAEILVKLAASVDAFCKVLSTERNDGLLAAFDRFDVLRGKRVRYRDANGAEAEGLAGGIAPDGALRVSGTSGEESLYSADVHLLDWQ